MAPPRGSITNVVEFRVYDAKSNAGLALDDIEELVGERCCVASARIDLATFAARDGASQTFKLVPKKVDLTKVISSTCSFFFPARFLSCF